MYKVTFFFKSRVVSTFATMEQINILDQRFRQNAETNHYIGFRAKKA